MKKLLSISALFMMVFAMISCSSTQAPKADLKTDLDSLAYASGINYTQGLRQYMAQQGVDSTLYGEFVKGLQEGFAVNKDDKKTTAHMLGLQVGQQMSSMMLPQLNQQFFGNDSTQSFDKNNFLAGFIAAAIDDKDILMTAADAQTFSMERGEEIRARELEKQNAEAKAENAKYLEDNKSKEGVVTLLSGLQYKVITEGAGAKPTAADKVKVHYHGTTIDGNVFDSSVDRGEPVEFGLGQVIPGWTEGVQLMPIGSKYTLYVPYDLAYGAQGRPGSIPPFATLIFEVELLDIVK